MPSSENLKKNFIENAAHSLAIYRRTVLEDIPARESRYDLKRLRQIADLIAVQALMALMFIICVLLAFWYPSVFVPVLGVIGLVMRYFYELSQRRLGAIDALSADILSIGRVFVSASIIEDFHILATLEKKVPHGFADQARQENYLSVYDANAQAIKELDSRLVKEVTSFYTFLKISRDATRMMGNWGKEGYGDELKRKDIATIVYQCLLCFIHGQRALELMISDGELREYASGIFLHLQGQALAHLKDFEFDQYRSHFVRTRWERFELIENKATEMSNAR